jgi:glycosyltransferase involved in cell wall biosynthesis
MAGRDCPQVWVRVRSTSRTAWTSTPFRILLRREERPANQLMMLYHNAEWKGCDDGLQALSLVREQEPNIRAILFGVPARPKTLPDWIEYHQSPSPKLLRELYNRAAIFVAPSRTEGWGLTGCEALLCGAALVGDGHRRAQGVRIPRTHRSDQSC